MTLPDGDVTPGAAALNALCRSYWSPIYWFIVREGKSPAMAQDLTQEFFAHLFEQNFLGHLRHQDGRFRSFLLTFLKHFLSAISPEGLRRDVWQFFVLPIPQRVWSGIKVMQDDDFVVFVDSCRNWK